MDETCSATTTVTLEQVPAQAGGTYPIDGGAAAAQGSYAQTGTDVLPIVIALAAIAVLGVVAFLIARRKRALAATVGVFAVATACMLPLPAFADISVTVPLETQATIAAGGTITIEDGQMVNTGDESFILSSVRLDAPAGVSGMWTLSSDGVQLFNGGVNSAQDADVTVEAGEMRPLDWSTTFGDKAAGALVGSCIATTTYTVAPLPALQGTVTFDDAPKTDVPLKAVVEGLSDGATAHYTWYVDGKVVLEGTDENSYTPSSDDGGKEIWVVVTDANDNYSGSLSSDMKTVLKKMTGTASLGTSYVGVASAATVSGTPSDATLKLTFYVDGSSVQSGTSKSYTPKVADNGKKLKVVVADTSGKYYGSISSAEVTVGKRALSGTLTVNGTMQPGQKLTASVSGFPSDAKLAYTWYVDGTSKGTGTTYTLASADAGKQVWASVSDTSGIYSGSVSSSKAMVLKPLSGTISVSGAAKVGSTLTAKSSNVPSGASLTYTWYVAGTKVATGGTYGIKDSDLNKQVWVTATDTSGKFYGTLTSDKVVIEDAYATIYSNGDMIFTRGEPTTEQSAGRGEVVGQYNGFEDDAAYTSFSQVPWYSKRLNVKSVSVLETIAPQATAYWFYRIENATAIDLSLLETTHAMDMKSMFYDCSSITSLDLSSFNTASVTNMNSMFRDCSSLASLDLGEHFDTSQVTAMSSMFHNCSSLTSLDLSSFNTSQVTNLGNMFYNCYALASLDLGEHFNTSQVTNMGSMFGYCLALTSLDLSSWNTSQVTNMGSMFFNCSSLTSLDLSSFNTSQVTAMSGMFSNCSALTILELGEHFDTSHVGNLSSMFFDCSSLVIDCSSWNVSKATYYRDFNYNAPGVIPPVWPNSLSLMSASGDESMEEAASTGADAGVDGVDEVAEDAGAGVNGVEGVETAGEASDEEPSGLSEDAAEPDDPGEGADAAVDVPQISETLPIVGVDGDALSGAESSSPAPYPSDELRFAA